VNIEAKRVITVFPSSDSFIKNVKRFTEIFE
jgi:hypothetical protein